MIFTIIELKVQKTVLKHRIISIKNWNKNASSILFIVDTFKK